MAVQTPDGKIDLLDCTFNEVIEHCEHCSEETVHEVTVTIAEKGPVEAENAKYSREPCRVSRCFGCGLETTDWLTR